MFITEQCTHLRNGQSYNHKRPRDVRILQAHTGERHIDDQESNPAVE